MRTNFKFFYALMALALALGLIGMQPVRPVEAADQALRISQVYGGGGNSGATYTYDYMEIFNGSSAPVSLAGLSLQYASATGTGNFGANDSAITPLPDVTLNPGQYYLVQGATQNANVGGPFPVSADLTDITPINLSGSNGKVALVNSQTSLGCNGGSTLCTPEQLALIIDLVGFGSANFYEGTAAAPAPSSVNSVFRKAGGCQDTDQNGNDFEALAAVPRNTASTLSPCTPPSYPERFIISEYVEGSSSNKALELYNGTGVEIDLMDYQVELYANLNTTPTQTLTWATSTPLAAGEAYVIVNSSAVPELLALGDIISPVTNFNGNDSLVLRKVADSSVLDSFGKIAENPTGGWGTGDTYTVDHTLVRKATVCQGDTDPNDAFEPAPEYDGFPVNTYTHLGSHTMSCGGTPPGDQAPRVVSTVPANNAINVAVDANITVTFSEPVTVTGDWYNISCSVSGAHTATVTDTDPVFVLDPTANFTTSEVCTVTIVAANVNDDDTDDETADFMEEDYVFSFITMAGCGDPFTPIYTIQGNGASTPIAGQTVTTEGVVTGDFQTGGKNGFFIQDATGDGDPATSDGIFVFYRNAPDVNVGDKVRITGSVSEYYQLTQLTGSAMQICSTGNTITPLELTLPFNSKNHESIEGMLVTFPQALVISEYFNFDRYGEILLTSTRHTTPTAYLEPGPDSIAAQEAHFLDSIAVDDGSSFQNPSFLRHPDGSAFTLEHYFRGGDTIQGLTGVVDYNFDEYKIQPVGTAVYEAVNLRTEAPELVPGEIRVASLNVLNYFVTLDLGPDICGPAGNMECRGADDANELERQTAKIVNAIVGMDADIVGLIEIENEHPGQPQDEPVATIVAALNDAVGSEMYDFIPTGPIGTDAIKQAILYKTEKVIPVGEFAVLDSSIDPDFDTSLNRPALAMSFQDKITEEVFTVSVNHLKSKGSACVGDPDLGDGAGNCNLTREKAAKALVRWLETDPTLADSDMYVIIGDLNSYSMEDPIDAIKLGADQVEGTADDLYNLVERFHGNHVYGYVYGGQTGYLDHALANKKLASYVLDANFWHINADEADVFDYDTSFKPDPVDAMFDPTTPYRASDHDPVLISLLLNHAPMAMDDEYTVDREEVLVVEAPGVLANDTDPNIYDKIWVELVNGMGPYHGTVVLNADGSFTYTPDGNFKGVDSFEYMMFATPGLMSDFADSAVVRINVTGDDFLTFLPLMFKQ